VPELWKKQYKRRGGRCYLALWLLLLLLLPVRVGGGHKEYLADTRSLEGRNTMRKHLIVKGKNWCRGRKAYVQEEGTLPYRCTL